MNARLILNLSRGTFPRRDLRVAVAVVALFAAPLLTARAQTNAAAIPNLQNGKLSLPPEDSSNLSRPARVFDPARIRAECIQGRRTICGRILKVLPDGLVVESGYTSLLRPPLDKSWLAPGTVQAVREPNLVEGNEPGCVCVGLVFLCDIPKSRSAKPKPYDYVVMQAYPAGQYTYTSVATLQRTVRRFAATLQTAILINGDAAGTNSPIMTAPIAPPAAAVNRN
jgi:hypothetical protein